MPRRRTFELRHGGARERDTQSSRGRHTREPEFRCRQDWSNQRTQ